MAENLKIEFQPCPFCFPDLWKEKTLRKLEPTTEQIVRIKEVYYLPEDGTDQAKELCEIWGVTSIEQIALSYAKYWFCTPHGFLVLDGQLIGPGFAIESSGELKALTQELNLSADVCKRAEEFALPERGPRRSWASNMGASQRNYQKCLPTAKKTWPEPDISEEKFDKVRAYEKERYEKECPHYEPWGACWPSLLPWFVAKHFGL